MSGARRQDRARFDARARTVVDRTHVGDAHVAIAARRREHGRWPGRRGFDRGPSTYRRAHEHGLVGAGRQRRASAGRGVRRQLRRVEIAIQERAVAPRAKFRDQARRKLVLLGEIAGDPQFPEDELPMMTLRQGLIGTRAQLRWAEEVLPDLRARAGWVSRSSPRRSTTGAR
jgi:hypothetical protein